METKQIGDILIEEQLITKKELKEAIKLQENNGGQLGKQLLLTTNLTRVQLYTALSQHWKVPFVDLQKEPCDARLLADHDPSIWTELGWVPWKQEGNILWVATSIPPSDDLVEYARIILNVEDIRFVATTDWDIFVGVATACRKQLALLSADNLAINNPALSASTGLMRWQKILPAVVVAIIIAIFIWSPRTGFIFLLGAANLSFALNVTFKVFAGVRWPFRRVKLVEESNRISKERVKRGLPPLWEGTHVPDHELPMYTILVPAYKETEVIKKVVTNISRLNYPPNKLDILILLEEDDIETIAAAKALRPADNVRIIVVPEGQPQTKPRACNYGLMFAKGEYVVIYDAEDQPDPNQLRDVIAEFKRDEFERAALDSSQDPIICVQAALNYFNADYNILTRMFAIEYSHWFDNMLPGLDDSGIPLPLGGTSNHFTKTGLQELGAWDPYNVTEDADLGLRAAAHQYRVTTVRSTTWEEACSQTGAWIKQRTRWIKGYMITAAVNMRHPVDLAKNTGWKGLVGMFGLILGTPLAFLLYPITLFMTLVTYLGLQMFSLNIPEWLVIAAVINMIVGNVSMIVAAGSAAYSRFGLRIALFAVFMPAYWLLHSIAAWRAAWQIVFAPFTWEKTPHGLTGDYEMETHTT